VVVVAVDTLEQVAKKEVQVEAVAGRREAKLTALVFQVREIPEAPAALQAVPVAVAVAVP
jgi:hypothetical protein